jgi:DNA-binding NarL/FixJ family response regulator
LRLVAKDKSNKEVAESLFIPDNKTAKSHIGNILDKLYLLDRTKATLHVTQHKWTQTDF